MARLSTLVIPTPSRARATRKAFNICKIAGLLAGAVLMVGAWSSCRRPSPSEASLEGRVFWAASNQPVEGVEVVLNDPQTTSGESTVSLPDDAGGPKKHPQLTVARVRTRADGSYTIPSVTPGSYCVSIVWTSKNPPACKGFAVDYKRLKSRSQFDAQFSGMSSDGQLYVFMLDAPDVKIAEGRNAGKDVAFVCQ